MKRKPVELEIQISTVKELLEKKLMEGSQKDPKILASVIVDNLADTDRGIAQLIMALLGIEEKTWWQVGDECLVDPEGIYAWGYDKEEMKNQGMYFKGCIRGKIIGIDLTKKKPITFEFEGLTKSGTVFNKKTAKDDVALHYIKADAEVTRARPGIADML